MTSRFRFISTHCATWGVKQLCRMSSVRPSPPTSTAPFPTPHAWKENHDQLGTTTGG